MFIFQQFNDMSFIWVPMMFFCKLISSSLTKSKHGVKVFKVFLRNMNVIVFQGVLHYCFFHKSVKKLISKSIDHKLFLSIFHAPPLKIENPSSWYWMLKYLLKSCFSCNRGKSAQYWALFKYECKMETFCWPWNIPIKNNTKR